MSDIRSVTGQIRAATYGKDVRENIALGIEQISDREDAFELTITNRQNSYEQTFNDAENTRKTNETDRINNESARILSATAMANAETSRVEAYETWISNENARVIADGLRQAEWLSWKTSNTMMNDLAVRKAVMIPVKTVLTIARAGLTFNPLTAYNPVSLTSIANDTVVDNGITKDNLCYYARNQVRGLDSVLFKTINEHILNGSEVI